MSPKKKALAVACGVGGLLLVAALHFVLVRPYLKKRRLASNETSAIAHLRAYLGAQASFWHVDRYGKGGHLYANPKDGTGFPDLYRVGGPLDEPDGTSIKLIDLAFASATSPETAKNGYWFVDIVSDKIAGDYDFTNACGLCAVPAVYGETGIHTFIVDLTGTVYPKDTKGMPASIYPDTTKDRWLPVSM
jgi:hypothetical protein